MSRGKNQRIKRYTVVRRVEECYEVLARNGQEAKDFASDPCSCRIVSESSRLTKDREVTPKEERHAKFLLGMLHSDIV